MLPLRFLLVSAMLAAALPAAGKDLLALVGTYTRGDSKGIHAYRLDTSTGKAEDLGLAGETVNPSFLAIHPKRPLVYAVSEVESVGGERGGAVSAFSLDPRTGKLTFLNKVSSKGAGPCFVAVDHTGKNVLVANYGGGSVAALPIKPDGSLAEASSFVQHTGQVADPKRQGRPHAHSINVSPDNRFAVAADLGLDKLFVYRFDPVKGSLQANDPPYASVAPRSGPRHFAWHPSGKFGYVINEISLTVTGFSYDARRGAFTEIQTISTVPADYKTGPGDSTAQIVVHPSGKFLYGSNRGHDSIAVFSVARDGKLTPVEHVSTQGKIPRNFNIDPTGGYLWAANQNSRSLVIFRIDKNTGKLTPTGQKLELESPVCVQFTEMK